MTDVEADIKEGVIEHDENSPEGSSHALKLDPHGFPLRPQPTDDPLGICLIYQSHILSLTLT